ncbi:hypothetical protein ES288_D02G112500v1 [Gossypium darwinii]|uniref:Small ubiquitin-related modifier n=1 Tax=Gossypium darwinii TaxID=34276 RepID=A0A5D2DF68_GOSDA|nr:hypothetical protein ES288_D02G112500v1 [Gossypium darwinii]
MIVFFAASRETKRRIKELGKFVYSNFFRIKRSTQLKKLMNAYCDRQSVDFNSIAFLFDGRCLRGEQTPNDLEIEDGDEIDAMLHQTGGTSA